MDWTQRRIDVPTEHMQNIFGGYDSYIRKIEDNLKVTIIDRDGAVKITAGGEYCAPIDRVIKERKRNPGTKCGLCDYDGDGR